MFEAWLKRWALMPDGAPIITPGSGRRSQPVHVCGVGAIARAATVTAPTAGSTHALVQVATPGGRTAWRPLFPLPRPRRSLAGRPARRRGCMAISRVCADRSKWWPGIFERGCIANVLHAIATMSPVADWIRSVIWPHQLKHRERFRIMDDRPSARTRQRQGVDNGLGKNPLRRVFFCLLVCRSEACPRRAIARSN